ncbi:carboxylating nicotinate-nucleotide diphosphorylase [Enteractinococcus fodinae]|uniref:nicotinate-nucleotide diphosphorylase (carboxylating) n=1 Tax=Enteractinococcus fodinae TaxID=684663 RepID=A0ABU2B551_9MICC|nr:carboxylating nicotinate-nucleotide diphosphorylase [Enteractinococcus fodinae]MDR7347529.1 nicotinate-nucleotide pyrophosphorylase (carboxylating) [Enteractinococcus fodinae]
MLTSSIVADGVTRALAEDAPWGDISVTAAIPSTMQFHANLVARQPGRFAGGPVLSETFRQVDPCITVSQLVPEGTEFSAGAVLASVSGPAAGILTAERVALNFVQRLSGIATLTAQFVAEVTRLGASARIADTRKTTPGLRALEKHAVVAGGGVNHRFSLSDAVMLKDNHLAALGATEGTGLTEAILQVKARIGHTTSIIVEVDELSQVEPVVEAGVTGVLLDNFSPADLRAGVELIDGRCVAEASGGVTLDTVAKIAQTGVDIISVGALTHGAAALDLGLDAA